MRKPGEVMGVEELLELESVKELRLAYSHCFDSKDLDGLVDLFTEDAICEFGPDYGGDWVGKEQIRANFAAYAEREGDAFEVLHAVSNPIIRIIDPETAHGRWYLHDLFTSEGQESPLGLYGIYDDLYKKVGDRWHIHRTRIDFLWPKRNVAPPREL